MGRLKGSEREPEEEEKGEKGFLEGEEGAKHFARSLTRSRTLSLVIWCFLLSCS